MNEVELYSKSLYGFYLLLRVGLERMTLPRPTGKRWGSLPYHIGNGIFGGLLPLIGLWVVARTGNIYSGLYYPIAVAGLTFIVGSFLLRETRGVLIWKELDSTE